MCTRLYEHRKSGFKKFHRVITQKLAPGGFRVEPTDQLTNVWTCLCFISQPHSDVDSRHCKMAFWKMRSHWRYKKLKAVHMTETKTTALSCPLLLQSRGIGLQFLISTCVCQSASLRAPLLQCRTQGALCCTWPLLCKYILSDCQPVLHSTSMWMKTRAAQWAYCFTCTSPECWDGDCSHKLRGSDLCVCALLLLLLLSFSSVMKHLLCKMRASHIIMNGCALKPYSISGNSYWAHVTQKKYLRFYPYYVAPRSLIWLNGAGCQCQWMGAHSNELGSM